MERIEVNVSTGKRKVIQLTPEEVADCKKRCAAEKIVQDAQRLVDMKKCACDAELMKLVNPDTGTTDEAKAYQAEVTKQGE